MCTISVVQRAEGKYMDYKQTGSPKLVSRNAPQHKEHNAKGSTKNPYGARESKAELLARMKAAAQARKAN